MAMFHFLNVNDGDCSIIEHNNGNVSVIDVCNASALTQSELTKAAVMENLAGRAAKLGAPSGNFHQKDYPVNPIKYMDEHNLNSVFRFILTHPDMDHMDGIKDFFEALGPLNFWDTANTCEKDDFDAGRYNPDDWDFYKSMRDGQRNPPKRIVNYSGSVGKFWNRGEDDKPGGNGLQILAPTKELVQAANEADDYNDCSYVLLYRTCDRRILLSGDSHDDTWEHIMANHKEDVKNVDLLIAPHHGRKSDRSYDFLDVVNPKQTYFGNAPYEHLAYDAWNNRDLPFITNNQANCIVVEIDNNSMSQYVTNESYAQKVNEHTFYSARHRAYYIGDI